MRVLNDYQCSDCLKTTEEYIEPEIKTIICSCGGIKYQLAHAGGSYFKIGKYRMDIDSIQWAKAHEKQGLKRES